MKKFEIKFLGFFCPFETRQFYKLKFLKYTKVYVFLSGIGPGRISIINSFRNSDIKILGLTDMTLYPHNGCRSKKLRRKKFRTKISVKVKRLLSPGF